MKSRTPLSQPDALSPAVTTFLGNLLKGVRITEKDAAYWNSHCDKLHILLQELHNVPFGLRRRWAISNTISVGRYSQKALIELSRKMADCDEGKIESDWLPTIQAIQPETKRREIDLTVVSPMQLGFSGVLPYRANYYPLGEIFNKALAEGLSLCPIETAILLLSDGASIFRKGTTLIASNPIYVNGPRIFTVTVNEESDLRRLGTQNGGPNCLIAPEMPIIFAVEE